MLKAIAILASIIAATPSWAQEVRVISGGIEHIYGPGGQVLDSPELRAMNERAERRMAQRAMGPARFISAKHYRPVQTSCWQTPQSWWNEVRHQTPLSWWNEVPHQTPRSWWHEVRHQTPRSWWNEVPHQPPKSAYSDC
jgi:hypothetical protein